MGERSGPWSKSSDTSGRRFIYSHCIGIDCVFCAYIFHSSFSKQSVVVLIVLSAAYRYSLFSSSFTEVPFKLIRLEDRSHGNSTWMIIFISNVVRTTIPVN